jgi:hypothetical protein
LNNNTDIEKLKIAFSGKESFTTGDLWHFYSNEDKNLNKGTFSWKVHNLKAQQILQSLKKGVYTLTFKPKYQPEIASKPADLFLKTNKYFKDINACIWSTKQLSEFMLHIPGKYYTILEVEADACEAVFHYLKDSKFKNLYLQPTNKEIELYINELNEAIIIKSLITKSPLQQVKKIATPRIEKILVDIFSDRVLFNIFQGNELIVIFNNVYHKYEINFSKLITYAKRRGKEKEIIQFISAKTEIPNSIFE